MTEEWRTVSEAQDYEVSSCGRVRSRGRIITTKNGQTRRYRPHMVAPTKNSERSGHLKVFLFVAPTKKIWRYVHALVSLEFIGPRPAGKEVAHWDGDSANNNLGNLRYATPVENAEDKRRHGTLLFHERHPSAKLSDADVGEIRSLLAAGERQKDIAAMFGVVRSTIGAISSGRSWRVSA
jgi:HNH endonuclease